MKTLTITLNNFNQKFETYDFEKATIYPKVGIRLTDGSVEYVDCGKFTIDRPQSKGSAYRLTGVDDMYLTERPYSESELSYPATLADIVDDIATVCGLTWTPVAFLNSTLTVASRPDDTGLTCRDVLGMVAQLACSFAYLTYDYFLKLGWYVIDAVDGYALNDIRTYSTRMNDFTISGIEYRPEDSTLGTTLYGSDTGSVISIENNKLLTPSNQIEGLTNLYNAIAGFTFRPYTCTTFTDFSLECGDAVILTTPSGATYASIVSNLTHSIRGNSVYSGDAETPVVNRSTGYSPISKLRAIAASQATIKMTAYEEMVMEATAALNASKGFYETTIRSDDGEILAYYQHDQPLLSNSLRVTRITLSGYGFSTDGGLTYPTTILSSGQASISQLASRLIVADLIKAGKLESIDGSTYFDLGTAEIQQTAVIDGVPYYIKINPTDGFGIYRDTVKILGISSITGNIETIGDILADDITSGSIRSVNGVIILDLDAETITFGLHLQSLDNGALVFTSSQATNESDYIFKKADGSPVQVKIVGTLLTDAVQWGPDLRAEVRSEAGNEGVDFVF